ncbi:MAG: slipin family protein, partial [Methanomicrobia archaeon]|nr:slipin family protein [Methanomicrobia archaeon]
MAYEWVIGIVFFVVLLLASSIKVVKEYERGVIFRLGRLVGARGPGLFLIIPIFESMVKIDLRVSVFDVTPQEV